MKKIVGAIILWSLFFGWTANAVEPYEITKRQREIAQTAISASGYINKELHDEFWSEFDIPSSIDFSDSKIQRDFSALIDRLMIVAIRFQYATWKSAQLSLEAGKVTYASDYEEAKQKVSESGISGVSRSISNAELVIRSAVEKTPLPTPNGLYYVTPEMVETVLNNLGVSLDRAKLLLSYEWNPQNKEYILGDAHLKVLSKYPFAYQKSDYEDGQVTEHVYVSMTSPVAGISILWFPVNWEVSDVDDFLRILSGEMLKTYGVEEVDAMTLKSKFRGLVSVEGTGTGFLNGVKTYVELIVVWREELGGVLLVTSMNDKSQYEATRLLQEFQQSMVFTK